MKDKLIVRGGSIVLKLSEGSVIRKHDSHEAPGIDSCAQPSSISESRTYEIRLLH